MKRFETVIVGGGLAGLGCAKRLHEKGKKFAVITEDIGGRVTTSPDGEVNYGAYYVTKDCVNIFPYLRIVKRMRFSDYHFHNKKNHYRFLSPALLLHFPAISRLYFDLRRFRRNFNNARKRSKEETWENLIEQNNFLRKSYHQNASEYIRDRGLEDLVKKYLEPALWASFFEDPRKVPTFIFLQCMLPLIVPSYSFKIYFNKIISGFQESIIEDSVISVSKIKNEFELKTKSGKIYRCKKLVLATPMTVTNKLIKPQKIKGTIRCSFMHVNGTPKAAYQANGIHFFPLKDETVISKEADGTYLYFYKGKHKINKYFSKWEVISKKTWKPALILLGDQYINLNPEKNLYLANDHNVASTEDAFTTGIYIANLMTKRTTK